MKSTIRRIPRLAALLLAAVMTLSMLPMSALAADEIWVSDEASLSQAVSSGAYDIIRLANPVEISSPLTVSGTLELDLAGQVEWSSGQLVGLRYS